jgi:hypothetical protein
VVASLGRRNLTGATRGCSDQFGGVGIVITRLHAVSSTDTVASVGVGRRPAG